MTDNELSSLHNLCKSQYFEVLRPPYSRDPDDGCPSQEFLDKHINTLYPATKDGATDFARRVDRMRHQSITAQTLHNTVFNAKIMSYREEDGGYICAFGRRASKYDCSKQAGEWNCYYSGDVIARHVLYNGHYDPYWDT